MISNDVRNYYSLYDFDLIRKKILEIEPRLDPQELTNENITTFLKTLEEEGIDISSNRRSINDALKTRVKLLEDDISKFAGSVSYFNRPELKASFIYKAVQKHKGEMSPEDTLKKLDELIKERNFVDSLIRPVGPYGGIASFLSKIAGSAGERKFKETGEGIQVSTSSVPTRIIEGLGKSVLFGLSWGKNRPYENIEVANIINELRRTDKDFYGKLFPVDVVPKRENVYQKGFGTAVDILPVIPEFIGAGKVVTSGGSKILSMTGFSKHVQPLLKSGRLEEALLELSKKYIPYLAKDTFWARRALGATRTAIGSTVSSAQFGVHSLMTGRPEEAPSSMLFGGILGASGQVLGAKSAMGKAISAGVNFPVAKNIRSLITEGELLTPEESASLAIAGLILHGTKIPGYIREERISRSVLKEHLLNINNTVKEITGIDILGNVEAGKLTKKQAYKYLEQIQKASEDYLPEAT